MMWQAIYIYIYIYIDIDKKIGLVSNCDGKWF